MVKTKLCQETGQEERHLSEENWKHTFPWCPVDALTSKTIFAQGESVVSTLNTNQSKANHQLIVSCHVHRKTFFWYIVSSKTSTCSKISSYTCDVSADARHCVRTFAMHLPRASMAGSLCSLSKRSTWPSTSRTSGNKIVLIDYQLNIRYDKYWLYKINQKYQTLPDR